MFLYSGTTHFAQVKLGTLEKLLDPFAGLGTTGAVAHKKGRKWIMVELGNHAQTHIIPRMKAVITGEDQGKEG